MCPALAAGNELGNHSWSHPPLNTTALDTYLTDVRRGEEILARVAPGQSWKVFRYPFLQQGNTIEKRDGVTRPCRSDPRCPTCWRANAG